MCVCVCVCVYIYIYIYIYSDPLRAGLSRDQITVEAWFSGTVQTDPRAHQASCTTGTGSFLEVKRSGRGVYHPPPSSAEVEGRVELYVCSLVWVFVVCSRVNCTFTFTTGAIKLTVPLCPLNKIELRHWDDLIVEYLKICFILYEQWLFFSTLSARRDLNFNVVHVGAFINCVYKM